MNETAVTAPHVIPPLEWTTWNDRDSSSELLFALSESIAALLWSDTMDPLQLKSQPYLLQPFKADDGVKHTVRLDLPPPSHLEIMKNESVFRLSDFCVSPSACKRDAADSGRDPITGKPLSLTQEQRETLKLNGHIHVPSRRFAAQNHYHTWQVARGFYSGSRTISNDFRSHGCGAAINHLIYASDAVSLGSTHGEVAPALSIRNAVDLFVRGILSFWKGLTQLFRKLDQPKYSPDAIEHMLVEARDSYVQSQIFQQNTIGGVEGNANFHPGWLLSEHEKHPKYFETAWYSDDLWDALEEDGEWAMGMKPTKKHLDEARKATHRFKVLRGLFKPSNIDFDGTSNDAIDAQRSTRAAKRFLKQQEQQKTSNRDQKWIEMIRNDERNLGPYAQFEIERIQAENIERILRQEDEEASELEAEVKLKELCAKYPILSWSSEWQRRQRNKIRASYQSQLQQTFEHRLVERLQNSDLQRMAKIRLCANEFKEKYRSDLQQKLEKKRIPLPAAKFSLLQFNPNNWDGNRYKKVDVSLQKPWWRFRHTFMVFWSATKDAIGGSYHFLTRGPLSFRALLGNQPFSATPGCSTQTLRSRIERFWSALSDVRQRFEAEPDTGLIGKSLVRIFLRGYLAIKAILGTAWIITFMTIGTLLASWIATTFILVGPIFGAIWAFLVVTFNTLIYDTAISAALSRNDDRKGLRKYYLHNANMSDQVTSPLVFHPLVAMLRFSTSGIRACLRMFRDTIAWPILKRAARVPTTSDDTWLAYRTHGPGLASETYFRLPLWSAKTAVLCKLDTVRLDLHDQLRTQELDKPYSAYTKLFHSLEQLGMACEPKVASPAQRANTISAAIFRSLEKTTKMSLNLPLTTKRSVTESKDVWERSFHTLISHHPDSTTPDWEMSWETSRPLYLPINKVDAEIAEFFAEQKHHVSTLTFQSPLMEIMQSIAPTFATWLTQKEYRQWLLNNSVRLPTQVMGRFRLSNDELDELWRFTLHQVQWYSTMIQTELEQIAKESPWLTNRDAATAILSFNHKKESIAILALKLLCNLFGETSMIETLEDLDETLVLDVGIAPEDQHLTIWQDNVGHLPSNNGPWHKLERVA